MPTIKLTQRAVDALKPPASGRVEYFDSQLPGFALRVADSGHKSWVLFYRVGGKQRRMTIGTLAAFPDVGAARGEARGALHLVERGVDPAEQRKQAPAAPQALAFGAIADEYLERRAKKNLKPSSYRETKRIFEVDIKPEWKGRALASITKRDAIVLLDKIVDRGAGVQANRTLARLKTFFNWTIEKDLLPASPVAGLKPPTKEKARDRALSDEEIVWFWKGCDKLGWPFGPLYKFLLVTAQRRDEAASIERGELSPDGRTWTIPREKLKNDKAHEVQLSDLAREVRASVPTMTSSFVFSTNGKRPVSGFSKSKDRLAATMEALARKARGLPVDDKEYCKALGLGEKDELPMQVPSWILHDLRRTATTGMARLNIAPHVVDKILNHTTGTIRGVAAVYNRYGYEAERRQALEAWGRYIENLIRPAPANIVPMRGAR